jgi:hypothetical protein
MAFLLASTKMSEFLQRHISSLYSASQKPLFIWIKKPEMARAIFCEIAPSYPED